MKIFKITGVYFYNSLGINKILRETDKKLQIRNIVIAAFVTAILGFVTMWSFSNSYLLTKELNNIGKGYLTLDFSLIIASALILGTTIYNVKSVLFDFKEFDLLMTLPVSSLEVVISRLLIIVIYNFLFVLIIMGPAYISYGLIVHPGIYFYTFSLSVLITAPIIPIVTAILIGSLITIISAKYNKKNSWNLIINIVVFVLMMICSLNFTSISMEENKINSLAGFIEKTMKICPFFLIYSKALGGKNFIFLMVALNFSLGSLVSFLVILCKYYNEIHSKVTARYTNNNFKMDTLKPSPILKALFIKELKRLTGSSIYFMNTVAGSMIMTIMSVILLFIPKESLGFTEDAVTLIEIIGIMIPYILSVFVAMTNTSASSISLEGKNIWILKTSPIKIRDVFISKIAVNAAVTIPCILVSSVVLFIKFKYSLASFVWSVIIPILYAVLTGVMGIVINLLFPKVRFNNDGEVVKQGMASVISMIAAIIISVPVIGIVLVNGLFIKVISTNCLNFVIILVVAIMIIIMYYYLVTIGETAFKKIQ